ncbi:hypothetical protein A2U01_0090410, partial [Trifolium medium]|nr:hypothetical protein [Trifolium medium]
SYIDLAGDSVGYDDAARKYEWEKLKNDEDVEYMFRMIDADPKYPRLYATLVVAK